MQGHFSCKRALSTSAFLRQESSLQRLFLILSELKYMKEHLGKAETKDQFFIGFKYNFNISKD